MYAQYHREKGAMRSYTQNGKCLLSQGERHREGSKPESGSNFPLYDYFAPFEYGLIYMHCLFKKQ